MTATVIPFSVFSEAREKKLDPKGYAGRKIHEAIDKQVKASEPLLVGKAQEPIDPGFDEPDAEDIPVMDRARYWGPEYANPLTRHFSQGDPGDETQF